MAERMKDIELLLGTSSSVLTSIETPFTSLLALLRERVSVEFIVNVVYYTYNLCSERTKDKESF